MKKILYFAAFVFAGTLTMSAQTTIEAYGKNTTTSTDHGDGTSTTKIECDTFYQVKCYKMTTVGPVKTGSYAFVKSYDTSGSVDFETEGYIIKCTYDNKHLDVTLQH